jgi:hypothetical protein
MIVIKKSHNIQDPVFLEFLYKFNNVVRFSYNRIVKNKITKQSDLEKLVKIQMKNIDILDASWIKAAVKKSTELQVDSKLYFGGKSKFFKRKYKKTQELDKNMPLEMRGSCLDKGNRKAKISGSTFIFKPFKGLEFHIPLNLSKNERRMLSVIEEESKQGKNYFNFKISKEEICISFNEPVLCQHEFKKSRFLGFDLNPNWIAISTMDCGIKEVFKELIDLRLLNKKDKNKKRYELSIISKHIISLCKHYQVEYVCLEDLNIRSSNKNLGRKYNKLVNNDWNRNFLVNNLKKWLNISDIKWLEVNPFYASFIGQAKNLEDYDSIAASKEIAFRGYLITKNINIKNYVDQFLSGSVTTRWKEMKLDKTINTFKDLYDWSKKKSKNSYRFLFSDAEKDRKSYFRLNSHKSLVDLVMV